MVLPTEQIIPGVSDKYKTWESHVLMQWRNDFYKRTYFYEHFIAKFQFLKLETRI